jgi:hypothetical protein
MLYIDTALLNAIEWCCRRFQVLTGRTNVWLALQLTNLSIIVYFIWATLVFWNRDLGWRIFVGGFCGGLIYVLTQTIFKVPVETYEQNAYGRVAKGLRNPRRLRDALLRVSFLTLSILLFYPSIVLAVTFGVQLAILTYSLIALTTVVLYLLACDPLPPCTGKVREWVRGLRQARADAVAAPLEYGARVGYELGEHQRNGVKPFRETGRPNAA